MASSNPKLKKRKLAPAEQAATQTVIDKLAALNLACSSVPQALALEFISSLKPGLGLLGTAEEEEEYYAVYVKNESNDTGDQVSVPYVRLKDTIVTDLVTKKSQADAQRIGAVDSHETQSDEPFNEERVKQGGALTLETYRHRDNKKRMGREYPDDEDIDLGDYEDLQFGRDFIEVHGEHIHVTEYFGTKWIQCIVSIACVYSYHRIPEAYIRIARSIRR